MTVATPGDSELLTLALSVEIGADEELLVRARLGRKGTVRLAG